MHIKKSRNKCELASDFFYLSVDKGWISMHHVPLNFLVKIFQIVTYYYVYRKLIKIKTQKTED